MGEILRTCLQSKYVMMVNPDNCKIICVVEEYAYSKIALGWIVVARESELLPYMPPYLIPADEPFRNMPNVAASRKARKPKDESDGA